MPVLDQWRLTFLARKVEFGLENHGIDFPPSIIFVVLSILILIFGIVVCYVMILTLVGFHFVG